MAYLEDQTASSMQSVVDQITAFAVANAGFVLEDSVTIVGATTTMETLSKGGMYYYLLGLIQDSTGITPTTDIGMLNGRMMRVLPSDSNYLTPTGIDAQRYPSKMCTFFNTDGSFEGLNLYTDGDSVHVVLEVNANVFAHMSFGICNKWGTWTGGEYMMANNLYQASANNFVFLSVNNTFVFDGRYSTAQTTSTGMNALYRPLTTPLNDYRDYPRFGSGSATGTTQYATSSGMAIATTAFTNSLFRASPNTATLRTMLIPIYIRVTRESNINEFHLQGHIPLASYLNIERLSPKEIVDVNWRVYPYCSKEGDTTSESVSGEYGLAYLRT
ncbi:MAG: hypothetical protein ABUK08_00065 [Candidatus Humimicrobiaceae bacterium]